MIDLAHLIPKADDTDTLRCRPAFASVASALKADLRLGVENRAAKPGTDLAQSQSLDRQSPAAVPTMKTPQSRVGVVLQAGQKEAAVLMDGGEQRIPEVAQIEQEEAPFHPPTGPQSRAVVHPLRGDLHPLRSQARTLRTVCTTARLCGPVGG